MTTDCATKCTLCLTRDLVPAPGVVGPTTLMVCPNCDGHVCDKKCDHEPYEPNFGVAS